MDGWRIQTNMMPFKRLVHPTIYWILFSLFPLHSHSVPPKSESLWPFSHPTSLSMLSHSCSIAHFPKNVQHSVISVYFLGVDISFGVYIRNVSKIYAWLCRKPIKLNEKHTATKNQPKALSAYFFLCCKTIKFSHSATNVNKLVLMCICAKTHTIIKSGTSMPDAIELRVQCQRLNIRCIWQPATFFKQYEKLANNVTFSLEI